MTMKAWLARPLRRALAVGAMMIGAQAGVHRLLFPAPEFPPHGVDRLVVSDEHGEREIRDRATIRRVVTLVRGLDGTWISSYRGSSHVWTKPDVRFYRRERVVAAAACGPDYIVLEARHDYALFPRRAQEAAELRRLLGIPGARVER
ncbi:MAG TPA: hypothetical protein VHG08_12420 [Longimicrobium sp.]|nr:hypothetical protein [Longimicrobium sp.]